MSEKKLIKEPKDIKVVEKKEPVESPRDNIKKEREKKRLAQREKDLEKVKGVFRFYEVNMPDATLSFNFRKYREDDIERYDLVNNKMYELPRMVAEHLVQNGKYVVHKYAKDKDGNTSMRVGEVKHRFGFESLEFMGNVSQNEIIQVDKISDDSLFRR